MNYFETLNAVNCSDKIKKKNGRSYLSWPYAWGELKKRHPTAFYTIYENGNGLNYHTDGKTAWVKTGVTVDVDGTLLEHIEYLPIMDYKNNSIPLERITSTDVNTAIQRSLTKAVARHGLGLYVYAGEDLPGGEGPKPDGEGPKPDGDGPKPESDSVFCSDCKSQIIKSKGRDGMEWAVVDIVKYSKGRFGRPLCPDCQRKAFRAEKEAEQ